MPIPGKSHKNIGNGQKNNGFHISAILSERYNPDMSPLITYQGHTPKVHENVYIAPGCQIIGRVTIEKDASIWFNSVLRGDINEIIIGEGSNIQDLSLIHLADTLPCIIGKNVLGGHKIILHGCTVADDAVIGMGAVVLNGAKIGKGAMVAAGAVVKENFVVPDGMLAAGVPAKIIGPVSEKVQAENKFYVEKYKKLAQKYKTEI
jgi:carbonic anhydrase/acetyltransferase-like protein (isoleucine patch superfamily)